MSSNQEIERALQEEAAAVAEAESKMAAAKEVLAEAEEIAKQANQKKVATKRAYQQACTQLSAKVARMEKDHTTEVSNLTTKHTTEVSNLTTKHTTEVSNLKTVNRALVKENRSLKVKVRSLKVKVIQTDKFQQASNLQWIKFSREKMVKDGPSDHLTFQVVQSPRSHSTVTGPVAVQHFKEPTNYGQFAERVKLISTDGPGDGDCELFPKNVRVAIVGSSSVWEDLGYFVEQGHFKSVSNGHGAIFVDKDGQFFWLDLKSSNGTYIIIPSKKAGAVIESSENGFGGTKLEDGTIMIVGDTVLMIRLPRTKKQIKSAATRKNTEESGSSESQANDGSSESQADDGNDGDSDSESHD